MKAMLAILISASISAVSLAQNCKANVDQFQQCLNETRQKDMASMEAKFESIKSQFEKCFTDNGCQPPAHNETGKGKSGSKSSEGSSSAEDHRNGTDCIKQYMDACIKSKVPDFNADEFHKDGEHDQKQFGGHGGFGGPEGPRGGPHGGHHGPGGPGGPHPGADRMGEHKLEGCAKRTQVLECINRVMNSTKPSEADWKAQFDGHCRAKNSCLAILGFECKAKEEKVRKTACECGQRLHNQTENSYSTEECKAELANMGQHHGGGFFQAMKAQRGGEKHARTQRGTHAAGQGGGQRQRQGLDPNQAHGKSSFEHLKGHSCDEVHQDICEQGFETVKKMFAGKPGKPGQHH